MAKASILVCDDEPHILHVLKAKLENAGHHVRMARDGEEALELVSEEVPDLLISDLQMPGLSGLDLCRRLRIDVRTAEVPVILLTAREYSVKTDDLSNTSIRIVLPKPFSPRAILAKVLDLLRERQDASQRNGV